MFLGGEGIRSYKPDINVQAPQREVGEDDAELENEIALSDIETECPRRTRCVPSFFCDSFNGVTTADQIVSETEAGGISIQFFQQLVLQPIKDRCRDTKR